MYKRILFIYLFIFIYLQLRKNAWRVASLLLGQRCKVHVCVFTYIYTCIYIYIYIYMNK